MNPFAKKEQQETANPGYVQIMLSYMRDDKNGTVRGTKVTNGRTEFGTRFFAQRLMSGMFSIVGRVEQAQDIMFTLNNGENTNVSDMLVGKSLNIRITEEEFEDLTEEAEDCENGIGISAVFCVTSGKVNVRKLTYQTGEEYNSYTVVADLVEDSIEETMSSLVSDSISKEELLGYFDESAKKDNAAAESARNRNAAARESVANTASLRNAVKNATKI